MGMQYVFVVDAQRRPLMPCRPARARLLLTRGHAAVLRHYPFIIILKAAKPDAVVHRLRLKIDPGSQATGLALVADSTPVPATLASPEPASSPHQEEGQVVWAAELEHRGNEVQHALTDRRRARRSRRQRHTWYREARYANRARPTGWLPPSLHSRVQGFKSGDMVKAIVPSGKPRGTHVGKVAVKARGYFTVAGVPDVPSRYCRLLQHADGYGYTQGAPAGRPIQ